MTEAQPVAGEAPAAIDPGSESVREDAPWRIRMMRASDRPFVCTHWVRSYSCSPFAKRCGKDHYEAVEQRIVNGLLGRPGVLTVVACDREDPELLYGFCCYDLGSSPSGELPGVLHYVFVRPELRGRGIARSLTREVHAVGLSHPPWKDYIPMPARAW